MPMLFACNKVRFSCDVVEIFNFKNRDFTYLLILLNFANRLQG